MRSFGFLILLFGGVIVYLGSQGKAGDAFSALFTGNIPTSMSDKIQSLTPNYSDKNDPNSSVNPNKFNNNFSQNIGTG